MPSSQNIAGQIFGQLTAIAHTGKIPYAYRNDQIWLFQCECGTLLERNATSVIRSVKKGYTPACKECNAKNKQLFNLKNYTGMTFGKLTAISDTGKSNQYRQRVWLFSCTCGALIERAVENVQRSMSEGNVPACPACRTHSGPRHPKPKRLDIVEQTFGNLTAIQRTGKASERRYAIWLFQCKCGDIVEKAAADVISMANCGWTPSCGKSSCNGLPKLPGSEGAFNRLYDTYKRNAGYRNLSFDLTKEQTRELFEQNCFYCGAKPSQIAKPTKGSGTPSYIYNGIDRVDNAQGYIPSNVVPCCGQCNRAKGKMTYDEFIAWLHRAARHLFSEAA